MLYLETRFYKVALFLQHFGCFSEAFLVTLSPFFLFGNISGHTVSFFSFRKHFWSHCLPFFFSTYLSALK
jgi:hypothetical protein